MLEALVSLRIQGETALKKRGDIIVVKLAGSPWGSEERKRFMIVQFEDAELEAKLTERRTKDNPYPVISSPYLVMEKNVPITRSTKYVDINDLTERQKADLLDTSKSIDVFEKEVISVKERA